MAADWLKIKNEYVNGGISYRALAEKYGLSFSTLEKRARAENWTEAKEKHREKIEQKARQEAQRKIGKALADEAAAKSRIRGKLIKMAEKWIDQQDEDMADTTDYRRIVQSCVDMGVFDEEIAKTGDNREEDALSKSLKELAEAMNNACQQ